MNRNPIDCIPLDERLPVVNRHGKLIVITLDQDGHDRTCDYWYLVQTNYCSAHTAFNKRENLLKWLEGLGLKLDGELPPHGTHGVVWVSGEYREAWHLSYALFDQHRARGVIGRALSNGQYTMSIITRDEDGIHTVHTLNPNLTLRPVYDYQESRALVG
ncbi:hypothetical protein P3T23_008769 [Paraburkholderia sp. GAS448]|uniref:hypothetical protein n=1 Tax=Paraburkholderia sp. GAS448 TaxID=3035136 RepID=UPI003D1D7B68